MNNIDKNELQRLALLEILRTPENNRFVEEARVSGASVEETARKILKSLAQSDNAAQRITSYITEVQKRGNALIKDSVQGNGASMYFDEAATSGRPSIVDEVYEAVMKITASSSTTAPSINNHNSSTSPIRKDEKTMSKHNSPITNAQRIAQLESWRNPENSRIIDEAIASGEAPDEAALRILNKSMKQQKTVDSMVAYAREIGAQRKQH